MMLFISKEEKEKEKDSFEKTWFMRFLLLCFKQFAKIPMIKTYISNTPSGLCGRIFRCWDEKDYKKGSDVAVYALERFRNKKSWFLAFLDHHNWWQLMRLGVDSARMTDDGEVKEKLIKYANAGIEPFEGRDVAYSFLEFSRWKHESQDYEKAIQYAERAERADKTWAEPSFVLGWYALLLRNDDAKECLTRAVEKDRGILFRIANDEICKQYPYVVNRLKKKRFNVLSGDES